VAWVEGPDDAGIARALSILGETADVLRPAEGGFEPARCDDVIDAVLAIITRHPMREQELVNSLQRWNPAEVSQALRALAEGGRAQKIDHHGQQFWASTESRYAEPRKQTLEMADH
jgi:hypothetical protein